MADTVKIEIDGIALDVKPGTMIIEVADQAGIDIPRFCYHRQLSIAASCRMCLVDVEKAPKPLPACATAVADGMKISTASARAQDAQKGTMEFLLINHPLDCPICDQGGECPLQNQAFSYGKNVSRFTESKRVVDNQDIGPLIATEMTRCIHCTRCVRFGQEVAGIMELGATGRGEHMKIGTYVGMTMDSEVSANVIDLCPVGALTSKPYRFTARPWELEGHRSVSPHDCVGTNLNVQSLRGTVRRVLPSDNEAVNECWLADRDRFSYAGVNSAERLAVPLLRDGSGELRAADWPSALNRAVDGLKRVITEHDAGGIGALASPISTVEEFYLLQKLMRALGSHNVDHRLRQRDFSADPVVSSFPGLALPLANLERQNAILLVGSNIRKDQPLIGLRVRHAYRNGARVAAVNTMDYPFHFGLAAKVVVAPSALPAALARIALAVGAARGVTVPDILRAQAGGDPGPADEAVAAILCDSGEAVTIMLGTVALHHAHYASLAGIAGWLAEACGAQWGELPDGNSPGGWLAGCLPHRDATGDIATPGRDARAMLDDPLAGYLLLGVEPELDCGDGRQARRALEQAEFVVSLSAYQDGAARFADVVLPMTPFIETSGTFINCNGLAQHFGGAAPPYGEARPAWKILRVLGNLFECPGFDFVSSEDVWRESGIAAHSAGGVGAARRLLDSAPPAFAGTGLERIADVPLYAVDPVVRRARPLQETRDNPPPAVWLNAAQMTELDLVDGARVRVQAGDTAIRLPASMSAAVPSGCAYIPAAYPDTAPLGAAEHVTIERDGTA